MAFPELMGSPCSSVRSAPRYESVRRDRRGSASSGIEGGTGKMLRLLDQRDQRRRITGDAGDLQLGSGQMQFGDVSMIRQNLAQRVEHDHAGRRLILATLKCGDRRTIAAVTAGANGGAPLRN